MTTQTIELEGELSAEVARQLAQNWYNATPQRLANAFYQVSLRQGDLYKVKAFELSQEDTLLLVNSLETEVIHIHMALVQNKWIPMLQGQKSLSTDPADNPKFGYQNCYLPQVVEQPPPLGKNNYTPKVDFNLHLISPEFASIYLDKWHRLTYGRMAAAFHNALESKRGEVKKRVRFYELGEEVVRELRAMQPETLTVFMGSGDAASKQHPFEFRPVVKAAHKTSSILFDFAHPCPPYYGREKL